MSTTCIFTRTIRIGSLTYGIVENVSADTVGPIFTETVANSITDKRFGCPIDQSQVQALLISSTGALTIKTNSSTSPTQTITLVANQPVIWKTGEGSCPITADVTDIYVTNSGASAITLNLIVGYDNTP